MNATVNDTSTLPSTQRPVREKPLVPVGTGAIEVFASAQNFEQAWRMSTAIAESTLVPEAYRKNPSNVLLAINIASRVRADVFAVMQSLDIIHGRPSWRSTYIIAAINSCGRYAPLQFHLAGEGMARGCVAWTVPAGVKLPANVITPAQAKAAGIAVIEGPEVTMAMAKAEGWIDRNGSKWKTIPELMLRYRAAAFFGRLNAPELLLGMQTAEEEQDRTIDITPRQPTTGVAGARAMLSDPPAQSQPTHTTVTPETTPEAQLALIRAAKSFKELEDTYGEIVRLYVDANKGVPLDIEAAYGEHKLHLEQQQS